MDEKNINTQKRIKARYIIEAFIALFITLMILPMFFYGLGDKSYWSIEGTILSILAALLSINAFIICPLRPILDKLATFAIFVYCTGTAIWAITAFILFGLHRYKIA